MTRIVWDQVGERRFEAGLDRGVIYVPTSDDSLVGVPWNGLTSVEEKFDDGSTPYHLDGVKYVDSEQPGDFQATIKAFTYPDELEEVMGTNEVGNGLVLDDQTPKLFGLSYRTLLGNDLQAADAGYQIHILFGVLAVPEAKVYTSMGAQTDALEFGWILTGQPSLISGFRPTMHLIFDPSELEPELLQQLEDVLYGSEATVPTLPSPQELVDLAAEFATLAIVDHGDGTWSATGLDRYFTMISPTEFVITDIDAIYLDANTYQASTTKHFELE